MYTVTRALVDNSIHAFEVKVRTISMTNKWEDIASFTVLCITDSPKLASDMYLQYLKEIGIDTVNLKEIRVNRVGSLQGHYFPNQGNN